MGCVLPQGASAQQEGTKLPVPHDQVISVNPFLLLGEWVNVEYERKVSPVGTIGAIGSWITVGSGDDEGTLTSLAGFYRYYPQGAALSGFFLEGRGGIFHVSDDDGSGQAIGTGIHVGYNWLFGANRSFYLSMGLGATRLFGEDVHGTVVIPDFRLLRIGIAF
jgi:hypothetical protein